MNSATTCSRQHRVCQEKSIVITLPLYTTSTSVGPDDEEKALPEEPSTNTASGSGASTTFSDLRGLCRSARRESPVSVTQKPPNGLGGFHPTNSNRTGGQALGYAWI